jgi:hypothetical protein
MVWCRIRDPSHPKNFNYQPSFIDPAAGRIPAILIECHAAVLRYPFGATVVERKRKTLGIPLVYNEAPGDQVPVIVLAYNNAPFTEKAEGSARDGRGRHA